jgi:hypothetical protein
MCLLIFVTPASSGCVWLLWESCMSTYEVWQREGAFAYFIRHVGSPRAIIGVTEGAKSCSLRILTRPGTQPDRRP